MILGAAKRTAGGIYRGGQKVLNGAFRGGRTILRGAYKGSMRTVINGMKQTGRGILQGSFTMGRAVGKGVSTAAKGVTRGVGGALKGAGKALGAAAPILTAIEIGAILVDNKLSDKEKVYKTVANVGSFAAFSAGFGIGAAVGGPIAFITGPVGGILAMFSADSAMDSALNFKLKVSFSPHNRFPLQNPRMSWKNVPDLTVAYLILMYVDEDVYWGRSISCKMVTEIGESSDDNIVRYAGVPPDKHPKFEIFALRERFVTLEHFYKNSDKIILASAEDVIE